MMAAILNSAMLDSATAILDSNTLLSSLRFTQKHSHSTLTLTQTNSIWLKLIHSHLTSWWQPCWIVPSLIQPFWTKKILHSFLLTQLDDVQASWILPYWIQPFSTKKTSLIHSDSSWWWQPSWILPSWNQPFWKKTSLIQCLTQLDDGSHLGFCHLGFRLQPSWIQTPCYLLSDSLKNTLTPIWLWLKLIQSDSNSFILTQLDDGSHLKFHHHELGHLGFSHLSISSQTHSHLPRLVPTICT